MSALRNGSWSLSWQADEMSAASPDSSPRVSPEMRPICQTAVERSTFVGTTLRASAVCTS